MLKPRGMHAATALRLVAAAAGCAALAAAAPSTSGVATLSWRYDPTRNPSYGCSPDAPCWVLCAVRRSELLGAWPHLDRPRGVAVDWGDGSGGQRASLELLRRDEGWAQDESLVELAHA